MFPRSYGIEARLTGGAIADVRRAAFDIIGVEFAGNQANEFIARGAAIRFERRSGNRGGYSHGNLRNQVSVRCANRKADRRLARPGIGFSHEALHFLAEAGQDAALRYIYRAGSHV